MKVFLLAGVLQVMSFCTLFADTTAKDIRKTSEYRDALAHGATASLRVLVVDDIGSAVSNVNVSVAFDMTTHEVVSRGRTDVQGEVELVGDTRGNSIKITACKEGYYASEKSLCFIGPVHAHPVKNGKWQPSPMIVRVPIRKITCPTKLVCANKMLYVPGTNAWYGFDMKVGDFVAPFGVGVEADFLCFLEWDGLPAWESRRCVGNFKFPADMSGGMYVKNNHESIFKTPYSALGMKVESRSLTLVDRDGDPHTTSVPFRKGASFVLRSRCVLDDQGLIKQANYSCIKSISIGPSRQGKVLLCIDYIFNPVCNDMTLEPLCR